MRWIAVSAPLLLLVAAALSAPGAARALDCANIPVAERLEEADGAFVGRVLSERPVAGSTTLKSYRFLVERKVKGEIGAQIDVRAPRLVDVNDAPIIEHTDESIGVLVSLDGATFTTDSCRLSSPGALLAAFDEPRGNGIRVMVGAVILLAVLVYSAVRLRRRQQREGAAEE